MIISAFRFLNELGFPTCLLECYHIRYVQMYCTCWFNFIWSDNCSTISSQSCLNCYLIFLIVVDYVYMHTRKLLIARELLKCRRFYMCHVSSAFLTAYTCGTTGNWLSYYFVTFSCLIFSTHMHSLKSCKNLVT